MKTADNTAYASVLASHAGQSPYVLPDYLNIVHPDWCLFPSGNFFFPLTYRRLAWFKVLEQPLLTQHFALVGEKKAQNKDYSTLLEALRQQFHHIDICIDASEFELPLGWKSQERVTYKLTLPANPADLRANYSQHLKRQLKKSTDLTFRNDVAISEFMPFLRENLATKTHLPEHFYVRSEALLRHPALKWEIYGAFAGDNLVAGCAILHHKNQRYYQLAANANEGKSRNAMHHLVDELLGNYCGQNLVFDFEGSMIVGLQRFYSGFGAIPYIYTRVSYSRLPWPISRWKHGI